MTPPAGAASATLRSVAATGTHVVAGGYAATADGDIPVVVVSVDDGGHWRQVVLKAPSGLGVITALTATPNGFTAAGVVGRGGSQHAVTWTSPDWLTWSAPTQAVGREITALTAAGTKVTGTAEQGTTPTLVPLPAPLPTPPRDPSRHSSLHSHQGPSRPNSIATERTPRANDGVGDERDQFRLRSAATSYRF